MEFSEYLAAVRRQWRTWVGILVVALAASALALVVTPRTYQATAQVFVSALPTIPNSAQFAQARAQSYPDVVSSKTVLDQVVSDLGLRESAAQLRSSVSSTVPTGASQVNVTVSDRDPKWAASIANDVAARSIKAIQDLETSASGVQPVSLSVSSPASAPSSPTSPKPLYVLGLGLLLGMFLGLAAAVVRSRSSQAIYDEKGVRSAWGDGPLAEILTADHGRGARRFPTGDPATALARRLEFAAGERSVRVAVLSPAVAQGPATEAFVADVAKALERRGLPVTVLTADEAVRTATEAGSGVVLTVSDPSAPLAFWKLVAARYDGVVLVVPSGRVTTGELRETRFVLRAADVETLAVAVTRRPGRGRTPVRPPLARSTKQTSPPAKASANGEARPRTGPSGSAAGLTAVPAPPAPVPASAALANGGMPSAPVPGQPHSGKR